MELKKEDFEAKASQIQVEIQVVLTELVKKRGNTHLPVETVNEVFHRAISHNLAWAYYEGLEVQDSKITIGSEDKKG